MGPGTEHREQRLVSWDAMRLSAEGVQEERVRLAREQPLLVRLDGDTVAIMMRTPGMDTELVTGYCICEGIVASMKTIAGVVVTTALLDDMGIATEPSAESWRGDVVDVSLAPGVTISRATDKVSWVRAVAGDVGAQTPAGLPTVVREVIVALPTLIRAAADLREGQALRQRAGGVHAFGLYRATGERLIVCEDVGRHNAMDKAVGWCLRHGLDGAWGFGLCSGRLSYEMVAKAARVALPVLVSFSTPSSLGAATAALCGITVLGYLDEEKVFAYTHQHRVKA